MDVQVPYCIYPKISQKNNLLWTATGYYVSTVVLNIATIEKYIREQEKQEQIEDSLSKKEYVDTFKGSK